VYTLQAAPPTLVGLAAGNQAYDATGFTPTIQSVTVASVSPPNVPMIRYTTDGTQPSCTTGLTTANPTTFNASGAPTLPQTSGQLQAITCKTGYLPSTVSSWSYTFRLTAPVVTGGTFFAQPTVTTASSPAPGAVVDAPGNAGVDVLCATTDGTAPTCATSGCATTDPNELRVGGAAPLRPGNATSATTNIQVVACPTIAGVSPSAVASGAFTLQLPPPFLSSNDPDALGQPGWDTTTDGLPVASFTIPGSYVSAVPYPYGDTCAGAVPCALEVAQVQGPGSGCTQTPDVPASDCTAYATADSYCFTVGGTASCGCANPVSTGFSGTQPGGELFATLSSSAGVTSGQTLSLVACQNPGASVVWAPSTVTTVKIH
jgi:hypothetical protein